MLTSSLVSHFMHENSITDTSDLWPLPPLSQVSRPPKLFHNCLCQELHTCASCLIFWVFMVETLGQRRQRLVKEWQIRELKERTAARVKKLKARSTGIATDVEERGTQCTDLVTDWTSCLNACLFCFLLAVLNLLFIQLSYTKGFLRFE